MAFTALGCARVTQERPVSAESGLEPPLRDSLRAKATVIIKKAGERALKGNAIIVAARPNLFRIEVRGPFRQTVALMLSDGEQIYLFREGLADRYPSTGPHNPFPFTGDELVNFLMGSSDESRFPKERGYSIEHDENGHIIALTKENGSPVPLLVRLKDFRVVSGVDFPFSVSIENDGEELRVLYGNIEFNPDIDKRVFRVPIHGNQD